MVTNKRILLLSTAIPLLFTVFMLFCIVNKISIGFYPLTLIIGVILFILSALLFFSIKNISAFGFKLISLLSIVIDLLSLLL